LKKSLLEKSEEIDKILKNITRPHSWVIEEWSEKSDYVHKLPKSEDPKKRLPGFTQLTFL
jgi:hypothetical protein